jgi:hypothetical protein
MLVFVHVLAISFFVNELCLERELTSGNRTCYVLRRLRPSAYNFHVARGWESKSIELQQEDARSTEEPKRSLSPEQKKIESHKVGLKLSRSRILAQLQSATNPLYRKSLEQALAEVDEKITRLA